MPHGGVRKILGSEVTFNDGESETVVVNGKKRPEKWMTLAKHGPDVWPDRACSIRWAHMVLASDDWNCEEMKKAAKRLLGNRR